MESALHYRRRLTVAIPTIFVNGLINSRIDGEEEKLERGEDFVLRLHRKSVKNAAAKTRGSAEIDITPLIDMLFMLIIFFVLTASFVQGKLEREAASGRRGFL